MDGESIWRVPQILWRSPTLNRLATPLIGLIACGVVLAMVHGLSHDIDYHAMVHALRSTPWSLFSASFGATAISYLTLIGRDLGGLRYVRARVPMPAALLAAFCGSALGNAVGFGA